MAKNKFDDPLQDIDPVMEDAFSVSQETDEGLKSTSSRNVTVSNLDFPELDEQHSNTYLQQGLFSNIPVEVSVELGRSTISLKEIYNLSEGAIVELDRLVGEPLNLVVNGQVIAQGEVVAIDNNFGIRIKTIIAKPNLNE